MVRISFFRPFYMQRTQDQGRRMTPKHLLFHCYPVAGNPVWRWNLDQLRQRIDLFDGRRVMAIAVDETTDAAGEVQAYSAGMGFEWIVLPNNRKLGEVASWVPLWERIRGEPGVTFRAHAKGVTAFGKKQTITCRHSVSNIFGKVTTSKITDWDWNKVPPQEGRIELMRRWAEIMYEVCLDYWPRAERLFEQHPIVGPFKHRVPEIFHTSDMSPSWIYAGTFYWVRNADFFQRDWRKLDQGFYGTENWPGYNYSWREAGDLFGSGLGDPAESLPAIEQALVGWRESHQVVQTAPPPQDSNGGAKVGN